MVRKKEKLPQPDYVAMDISKIHAVSRLLREIVNYPGHAKRTNSPEYSKVHRDLAVVQDLPCLVCGVRNSTLKSKKENPCGARQMETHHHLVEWALANALDLGKFNERIVAHFRLRPHHDPIYNQDFTEDQMLEWVDHHPDNLWVLCDIHHRTPLLGIHEITFPIWGPQDIVKDDFRYIPAPKGKKKLGGIAPMSVTAEKALNFLPPSAKNRK